VAAINAAAAATSDQDVRVKEAGLRSGDMGMVGKGRLLTARFTASLRHLIAVFYASPRSVPTLA
jgi:hypothetical protein